MTDKPSEDKGPPCDHEPDWSYVQSTAEDVEAVEIRCRLCGEFGTAAIKPSEIKWEEMEEEEDRDTFTRDCGGCGGVAEKFAFCDDSGDQVGMVWQCIDCHWEEHDDDAVQYMKEQQRRDEKNGLYPGREDPAN